MFVSSCQSVDMTIDIVKHEVRFHVVTSTLPLPRCRFHVFASTLPLSTLSLPSGRFHVIASKLSQERERDMAAMFTKLACLHALFSHTIISP